MTISAEPAKRRHMGTRLENLEKMLAARTRDNRPAPGFKKNVAALQREISRLKTTANPGEASGG